VKKLTALLLATTALVAFAGNDPKKAPADAPVAAAPAKPAPITAEERPKVLYALGALVAQRTPLAQAGLDEAELNEVMQGFMDATLNKPLKVPPSEAMPKVDQFLRERQKERGEKEKAKGLKYLEEQAAAPGAKKTASGLIYFETQAGTGAQPTPADTVKVHYKGTLIDGKEFDSSYKRGTPAEFPLGGVIKCWTEGVAMMKVGGKARLVCPSEIAYGERGAGGSIPGNAVLNFEVELLGIVGK
jgi:FKBP-type peptidyl-prolyl cis-trans isomerase